MSAEPQRSTPEQQQPPQQRPGWKVDPPAGRKPPEKPPHPWRRLGWRIVLFALILFAFNYWAASRATKHEARPRVPYSPFFLQQVDSGNVAQITSKGTAVQGELEQSVDFGTKHIRLFKTEIPAFANTDELSKLLQEKGVIINAQPLDTGTPWWESLLFGFGPTLLFLLLLFWVMRRASGGGGLLGAFGRSRARRYEPTAGRVTFADVAGIDEAKGELTEIVDFLRNPDRYRRLGGRIPRGVLLSGPPGTGKTLLARAVAGEADVPFFSLSASEFIEAIVGVGASRVRDLFTQAKADAPAIIFIDELDAIGRARGGSAAGIGGGHDEREQTLNQILTEMDGFDSSTGVIVLAATNRPDVLDSALLRPGRFDRRVAVQPPDRTGRRLILEVHTRSVPLAPDVDLDRIASNTPGMVGADLANLVNEAALLAARRDHAQVTASDFADALERILLGAERKIMLSLADRERTAYHEAGHAIVGMVTPGADPVRKVSIIPRGQALGVTFSAPEDDRFSYDETYLKARLRVALGGRAADELVWGERTTGAEADIRQLTEIARQMVGRWGMSDAVGPIAVVPQDGQYLPGTHEAAERTHELLDAEVHRLVDEAHEDALELLRANRDKLDSLARALLAKETLDEDEAYAAAGMRRPRDDEVSSEVVGTSSKA
ncbi:MAG TPA: ATP-dependent zinc metalloprotease FtsH [Gaiellaceae bacterium]